MTKAIVAHGDRKHEIRCGMCGKLLFVIKENSEIVLDRKTQDVIIVARCTRNCCKADNQISLSEIF